MGSFEQKLSGLDITGLDISEETLTETRKRSDKDFFWERPRIWNMMIRLLMLFLGNNIAVYKKLHKSNPGSVETNQTSRKTLGTHIESGVTVFSSANR